MSFVKKFAKHIQITNINNLYLILGETNSQPCWYYLLVDKLKSPIFVDVIKNLPQNLELTNFGEVILSDWGEKPPRLVQERVKNYQIDDFLSENEIMHVETKDIGGNEFFAFVSLPKFLVPELKKSLSEGANFQLQDYGHIIKWGWGQANESDFHEIEASIQKTSFENS